MVEKALLDQMLRRIKIGSLMVTYWDGNTITYGQKRHSALHISITDKKVARALAKNVSLGFGESYMDGTLQIHCPLEELLAFAYQNQAAFDISTSNRLYKKFNRNIKRLQRSFIAQHYDLGNDFYKLWLDTETLGYTCSYYKSNSDTLEQGQVQKFDYVLSKLQIKPGQDLLDIGFGWGYLLIRAAKRFGVKGVGVSLSQQQHDYATAWAKREKVDKLVEFKLMNYQDLPLLGRQFDRIVSVGFFEHVGQGNHKTYFDIIHTLLKSDGISVLHSISQLSEDPADAWLDRYIFPGGYIPSIREVTTHLTDYNFVLKDYENIGPHYILTLTQWWERFEQHKQQIIEMYDERFYRMWRLYLLSCREAFRAGQMNLSQWTFTRSPGLDWPLTREYLYKK